MCLFAALYLDCNAFYGNQGDSTMCSWVKNLGAMPAQWEGRFWWPEVADDAWYDHTKTVSNPERDLAARIARSRPVTSQAERKLVLSVMLKVLCYLPERRIVAEQLLQNHGSEPSWRYISVESARFNDISGFRASDNRKSINNFVVSIWYQCMPVYALTISPSKHFLCLYRAV
jgi:hypothetical protein